MSRRPLQPQCVCDSVVGIVKLNYHPVSKILVSDLHCGSVICIADFCCIVCTHLLHGTPSDVSMKQRSAVQIHDWDFSLESFRICV